MVTWGKQCLKSSYAEKSLMTITRVTNDDNYADLENPVDKVIQFSSTM